MALEQAHEEIGKRVVFLPIEGEVLAVIEATACEEDGHVTVIMGAGISEVRGEEDAGAVEHGAIALLSFLELADEASPGLDEFAFDAGELVDLFFIAAVVAEAMVAIADALDGDGSSVAIEVEGDVTG